MPSKNPKQPGGKGRDIERGNPAGRTPAQGDKQSRPGTGASPARFDDRPDQRTSRSGESSRESNPSIPRYGDTERDDPRRSHTEAGGETESGAEDLEDEGGVVDEEER